MYNTLKIEIEKKPIAYIQEIGNIVIRHEYGKVVMFVRGKRVEFDTITAHDIGYNVAMAQLESNELIVFIINGERIQLLGEVAKKVAIALLRKADDADDWQIGVKK